MKHLRCLSWATVSSEEQAESDKFSLPGQLSDNREFIETLPRRFPGYSGRLVTELTVERSRKIIELSEARRVHPAYDMLYRMIHERAFDLLVCRRRDRLGREESLIITLEALCLKHGIVVAARDSLPPSLDARVLHGDEGWRITTMVQAWQSGAYVRDLGIKVTEGRRDRVLETGRFIADPPYGYKLVRNEDDERVAAIDPGQAAIVRRILLDWYLGESWGAPRIRDELNALGVPGPAGKHWYLSSVSGIVARARIYAGDVAYGRSLDEPTRWTKGQHEPIITLDELARVEAERSSRSRGQQRRYAFSGLVQCGRCGVTMGSCYRKQFRYYYCRACGFSGREDRIVAQLAAAIDEIVNADIEELLRAAEDDGRAEQLQQQIAQQQGLLAELQTAQSRLLDAYESGTVPLAVLSKRMDEKRQQMEGVERSLSELKHQLHERQLVGSPIERIEEIRTDGHAMLALAAEDPDRVRRWFRQRFLVIVENRHTIHVHTRFS